MAVSQPDSLSLGLSPCPNDTYIFHALLHGLTPAPTAIRPYLADVEQLNALARQKKLDVTKMSLGAAAQIMDDYALLSSGAALGWGCGPLVVARKTLPPEAWREARVAVPGLLTTANLLLTLHGGFQGPRREMLFSEVMPAVACGDVDLGVIIHEGRFTYARMGLTKLLDLGQWWEEAFHLPPASGRHCRAPGSASGDSLCRAGGHCRKSGLRPRLSRSFQGLCAPPRPGDGRKRDQCAH